MKCSIIYYISYKTGYIQRVFGKKFRNSKTVNIISSLAAVSVEDLRDKFSQALEQSDVVFIIGGMSAAYERNIITVLSDFFSENDMVPDFNKKIVNPDGGADGNLIKSGSKYVAVLPDEPAHIEKMVGNELMKNIDVSEQTTVNPPEAAKVPAVVFAPEPDNALDERRNKRKANIFLKVCITVGIITVLAAAAWIAYQVLAAG